MKAILVSVGIAVAGLTGAALGATLMPRVEEVEVPYVINNTETVVKEVEVEKEVEVPVENPVNEKLLDYIQRDNEDMTKELIMFEYGAMSDSEVYVEDNMVSLLEYADYFRPGNLFEDYRTSEASIWKMSDATTYMIDEDTKRIDVNLDVRIRVKAPHEASEFYDFKVSIPYNNGEMVTEDIEITQV